MKTLALVVPKSKLQPPPKNSEIIDALTRIRVTQLTEENATQVAERAALLKEVEAEIIAVGVSRVEALPKLVDIGWSDATGVRMRVYIEGANLPKQLKAKVIRLHKLPSRICAPHYASVRKEISAASNGIMPHDQRVTALLSDSDSKSALEKMLKAIL